MAEVLSSSTFDVILAGLNLRDRIASGDRPHLPTEQARLKGLLAGLGRGEERGDRSRGSGLQSYADRSTGAGGRDDRDFLGARYALVCWLDDILIEAGWREWDENKLEQSLYRTNIRYGNFWQQARLADADPAGEEAQAAYLLSVLLGFRGEVGESQERLREWVSSSKARITKRLGKEPSAVPEKAPVSDVPPLMGIERYRQMTRRLVGVVLLAIPIIAFLLLAWLR